MTARAHLLPLVLALAAGAAVASGNTVYKWKDADGGLHFSDTPPPAGATLISGPAGAAPQIPPAMPVIDCGADVLPADCAQARESLGRDAEGLKQSRPPHDPAVHAHEDQKAASAMAHECDQLRQLQTALQQRQDGNSSEILTDEERAALPAAMADVRRKLAEICL
jgi:hypothetical protein